MKIRGVFLGLEKVSSKSETIKMQQAGSLRLPDIVIPMAQCAGEECKPVVEVGSKVKAGQKIGDGEYGETPVHASVSGYVKEIRDIVLPDGRQCKAVVIEDDGMMLTVDFKVPKVSDSESFIEAVRESGCVGLSGAGDSTAKKLKKTMGADMMMINAVECDPLITADHRCMMEESDDIARGVEALIKFMGISRTIIAVSFNNEDARKEMERVFKDMENVSVETVLSSYPQGSEKVLVNNLAGKVLKGDTTAADEGILVLNVSTAAFIGSYLRTGITLIEKRVTVSGDMIKHPCNLKVPVGTAYSVLLDFMDTNIEAVDKLICGGVMMGKAVANADMPICKADNCLLALIRPEEDNKGKLVEASRRTHCLRCARCVSACAMGLMPLKIAKAADKKDKSALKRLHAELCDECGACSFVCPAMRPLADKMHEAKEILAGRQN